MTPAGCKRALIQAASNGQLSVVKELLTSDPTIVNCCDEEGSSPLMCAVAENQKSVVHYLLEHGADPSMTNNEGRTALLYAASNGNEKLVSLLIRKAQHCVGIRDKQGYSALIVAICQDKLEIVKKLLETNKTIAQKRVSGFSPLILAIHHASDDLINTLLDAGVSADEATHGGNSALIFAATRDRPSVVRLLIAYGAKIDSKNHNGETPLFAAARRGSENACKALLDAGALVHIKNKLGDAPLHCAAANAHVPVLKLLLSHKADVNVKNYIGITPLMSALNEKSPEAVQCLLQAGADVHAQMLGADVLLTALQRSSYHCLRILLDAHTFDLENRGDAGDTRLLEAIKCKNCDAVAELLNRGAQPNVRNDSGDTPLTLALRKNQIKMVVCLLGHKKIDVNQPNSRSQTPLMLAALLNKQAICTRLLELGARMDVIDEKGRAALDYALVRPDQNLIRELLKYMKPPLPIQKLKHMGIELSPE